MATTLLAAQRIGMSVEEYLRLERESLERHEFVGGIRFAMAGDSRRHNRIVLNIASAFTAAAVGGASEVTSHTVHVQVNDAGDFYYPDVVVACEPSDNDPYIVTRPCVVVEVLSPSTRQTDLREKLARYVAMPSLQAYFIVHQETARVTRHWRDKQGAWWQVDVIGEGVVPVPCLDAELSLAQIYRGVQLTMPE